MGVVDILRIAAKWFAIIFVGGAAILATVVIIVGCIASVGWIATLALLAAFSFLVWGLCQI